MKIREYLTEEKIPSNVKKEIMKNIESSSTDTEISIQNYKVKFGNWRLGRKVVYDRNFMELTILLTDICDTLDYKFTKKDAGKNTIFGIENK